MSPPSEICWDVHKLTLNLLQEALMMQLEQFLAALGRALDANADPVNIPYTT